MLFALLKPRPSRIGADDYGRRSGVRTAGGAITSELVVTVTANRLRFGSADARWSR